MVQGVESTSWHSYPKIYALGHAVVRDLFADEVTVEEKVDGSAFSFGSFDGELKVRSKSVVMDVSAPEKMFTKAVETAKALHEAGRLHPGWTYRCEYLQKPKHNTLAYDRTPKDYLIGYDVNDGHETYLGYEAKRVEFERLGLETVPLLHSGRVENYASLRELLETTSILGGQKIEGFVVKNYKRFGLDGKVLLGKFVSEEFKEIHQGDWKERNPGKTDLIELLIAEYTTAARWNKAIYRLRDEGRLENSPRDIGLLVKEVPDDIRAECEQEIRDKLFEHFWDHIRLGVTRGLPQFYKEKLARSAFDSESKTETNERQSDKTTE